jgi:hypothetical protein
MSDIVFTLKLENEPIVSGGGVVFQMSIVNHGKRLMWFPNPDAGGAQPVYRLKRPDGQIVTFTTYESARKITPHDIFPLPPEREWKGTVVVDNRADVRAPGRYELEASLDWEDTHAYAAPVRFVVTEANLRGMVRAQRTDGDRDGVLLIQGSGQAQKLAYQEVLPSPTSPDLQGSRDGESDGNVAFDTLSVFDPLPSDTRALFRVQANQTYTVTTVALTDRGILVQDGFVPGWIATPKAVRRGLQALKIGDVFDHVPHELSVFAILAGEPSELAFAHVQNLAKPTADFSLSLRTIASLGPGWVAAQSALGPAKIGSPMIVASLASTSTGARVTFLRVASDGQIVDTLSTDVAGYAPEGPVAVCIDGDKRVEAAFAARAVGDTALHLVRIPSQVDLSIASAAIISPAIEVGEPIREILIEYGVFERPKGPAMLVRTTTGRCHFFSTEHGRRARPVAIPERDEIALIGASYWWYVVSTDGARFSGKILASFFVEDDGSPGRGADE